MNTFKININPRSPAVPNICHLLDPPFFSLIAPLRFRFLFSYNLFRVFCGNIDVKGKTHGIHRPGNRALTAWPDVDYCEIANRHMNIGIRTEVAQFFFREHINSLFGTVHIPAPPLTTEISLASLPHSSNCWTDTDTETGHFKIWFSKKALCRWFRFAQLAKGKKSRP